MSRSLDAVLADIVAVLHGAYAASIVVILLLVLLGYVMKWEWIRNPWFRSIHLVMIAVVVAQSWVGIICPLTTLEAFLRRRAGQGFDDGSVVTQVIHAFLFYHAPWWVFTLCYSLCGILVGATFVLIPPRWSRTRQLSQEE